jgi:hypothetical protein
MKSSMCIIFAVYCFLCVSVSGRENLLTGNCHKLWFKIHFLVHYKITGLNETSGGSFTFGNNTYEVSATAVSIMFKILAIDSNGAIVELGPRKLRVQTEGDELGEHRNRSRTRSNHQIYVYE